MSGLFNCFSTFRRRQKRKNPIELEDWRNASPTPHAMLAAHYSSASITRSKTSRSHFPQEESKSEQMPFESQFNSLTGTILRSSPYVSENNRNFEKLLELEREKTGWKLLMSKSYMRVHTKKETPFIVKIMLDLEIDSKPDALYYLLYNPRVRKHWDRLLVLQFYNIESPAHDVEHYYMLSQAPWPYLNRDFVEKRYTRKRDNGDIEVFYCDSPHPRFIEPNSHAKIVRARTLFGGTVIRKRISQTTGEPTLLLTLIYQADMKENLSTEVLKQTLPINIMKWCRRIKKQLISLNPNQF